MSESKLRVKFIGAEASDAKDDGSLRSFFGIDIVGNTLWRPPAHFGGSWHDHLRSSPLDGSVHAIMRFGECVPPFFLGERRLAAWEMCFKIRASSHHGRRGVKGQNAQALVVGLLQTRADSRRWEPEALKPASWRCCSASCSDQLHPATWMRCSFVDTWWILSAQRNLKLMTCDARCPQREDEAGLSLSECWI